MNAEFPPTEDSRAGNEKSPGQADLAAGLVLLTAFAAPWLAGATVALPAAGWLVGGLAAAGFLTVLFTGARARRWPAVSAWVSAPVTFLLGCLGWWATRPEPAFATPFAAEHWRFLQTHLAPFILEWPRAERLIFFAGALLALLASADLGRAESFRRQLFAVIGGSGLVVALWALGIRWLGWGHPPWIELGGDTERFNVAFFHHNAAGAALNLAWPLLFFGGLAPFAGAGRRRIVLLARLTLLLVVGAALPLWHSASAPVIAGGLLLAGLAWPSLARRLRRPRIALFALIAGGFVGLAAWQVHAVEELVRTHPDGWIGAAETLREAPVRDAVVRAAADQRRDRLVVSDAPPRPVAWLTALRMARDHPLVGPGPGTWVRRAGLYSNDPIVSTFYQHRQFAHHDLLQTAAEWGGLPAFACLCLWIGALWRATRPDPLIPGAVAEPGLLLALLGMALLSLVHFPLQNPALLLWTALLLGLAWSRPPHPRGGKHSAKWLTMGR